MRNFRQNSYSQAGIALPMTMILLLVMTLVGIVSLNTSVVEEQMAANTRLREIAFNAAESALRAGEQEAIKINKNNAIRLGNIPGTNHRLFAPNVSAIGWPEIGAGQTHPGDTCTSGYCTAAQFHLSTTTTPNGERWEDPSLDVWNNANRHLVYEEYSGSGLAAVGVEEAPQYIIEFLGNYPSTDGTPGDVIDIAIRLCDLGSGPIPEAVNWPYCISPDHSALYRITARAVAGNAGREAAVILQSTVKVPIN